MGYLWTAIACCLVAAVLWLPVRIEFEAHHDGGNVGAFDVSWLLPGRMRVRLGIIVRTLRVAWRRVFARIGVEVEAPGVDATFDDTVDTEGVQETVKAQDRPLRALLLGVKALAAFVHRGPSYIGSPALALASIPPRLFRLASHRCERLELRLRLGTGDAAATSLALGALWGTLLPVVGAFASRTRLDEYPRVVLRADYAREVFEFHGRCILNFSLGQLILMGLAAVWRSWYVQAP